MTNPGVNNPVRVGEVFPVEEIKALGLEYREGTVRTLNKTGYMRNFLCAYSLDFCAQRLRKDDSVLEIGIGIGAVLRTLVNNGAKNIAAVDPEEQHLGIAQALLKRELAAHPGTRLELICDSLPHLVKLQDRSFRSILCAQVLHYLRPEEFMAALYRLREVLQDKGSLYITIGSPYIEKYKGFSEQYRRQRLSGNKFPGYMEDTRKFNPDGVMHNPGFFLFFDPEVLADRVRDSGFKIIKSELLPSGSDKAGQTGIIAVKGS